MPIKRYLITVLSQFRDNRPFAVSSPDQRIADGALKRTLLAHDSLGDVVAGLLEHLANGALHRHLVLVDLPLGKTPIVLGGEVALYEQHIVERLVQHDHTVCGHIRLVGAKLVEKLN